MRVWIVAVWSNSSVPITQRLPCPCPVRQMPGTASSELSVDGKTEKSYINNFVENEFLSRDSFALREYLIDITPDMNMNIKITDSNGKNIEVAVPITVRFFWPSTGI